MTPIFLDFHIHTSPDPTKPNPDYDLEKLKEGLEKISDGGDYLICLSDHNFINKEIYLKAKDTLSNILVGAEIHIRNFESAEPYHCHILFNIEEITAETIDALNKGLDDLYPEKRVKKDDMSIPKIEKIVETFNDYEFLLLPHGGQNHSTFDKSIPEGVKFDRTLERSLYYNFFDGFTARSNESLERTHSYFERLGIKDIINLVTATDNYFPDHYPECKARQGAKAFIPTWMLAEPTFDGLRLSLSESSRLIYGARPDAWSEFIKKVHLQNDHIDIDIHLTSGLNVIIGGSSSGKSLLADSIYNKIRGDFSESSYSETDYLVDQIEVQNPSGFTPHYFDQNYISRICNPKDSQNKIEDIPILKDIFPDDADEVELIARSLSKLKRHLSGLITSVETIEGLHRRLSKLLAPSHLIIPENVVRNPLRRLLPAEEVSENITYTQASFEDDTEFLDDIGSFLSKNPLVEHDASLITKLKEELKNAFDVSLIHRKVTQVLKASNEEVDQLQKEESSENATKRKSFEDLLDILKKYDRASSTFRRSVAQLTGFEVEIKTKKIESMGHGLSISNEFELTEAKLLEVINTALKQNFAVPNFAHLMPESLFSEKWSKRQPKISTFEGLENHIFNEFQKLNKKCFEITTSDGRMFDELSAGWKTSVLLDLILGWDDDHAPLIIDQPEDNLATGYINSGLLDAIKKSKANRQVIIVSHNATIPILGDAQNIVMCENDGNKITIRSSSLEGSIDNVKVLDLIAKTADGGKPAIKKRVKKYNLKNYRPENEVEI